MPERLLLPAFEALRTRGIPLGIPEYLDAVEAFREGCFFDFSAPAPETKSTDAVVQGLEPEEGGAERKSSQTDSTKGFLAIVADGLSGFFGRGRSSKKAKTGENLTRKPTIEIDVSADLEGLRHMLRLLWAKRREDLALVDAAVREFIAPRLMPSRSSIPAGTSVGDANDGTSRTESRQSYIMEQKAEKNGEGPSIGGRSPELGPPLEIDDVFRMTPRPPVGVRRAVRSFRPLRRPNRRGALVETDIDATIQQVCREGYLIRPVLRPLRFGLSTLRVLVDHGGSMTPFSPVVNPLLEALRTENDAGRLRVRFFWFHDSPADGLFETPNLAAPVDIEHFFAMSGGSVLIFGDAGAARGDFDGRRVRGTHEFLRRLAGLSRPVAWINPVPSTRWAGSTAETIAAEGVSMFPLSRRGLEDAVATLRGGG